MNYYIIKRRLWNALATVGLLECVLILLHFHYKSLLEEGQVVACHLGLVDVLSCIGGIAALLLISLLFWGYRFFGVTRDVWKHGRAMTAKDAPVSESEGSGISRSALIGLVPVVLIVFIVGGLSAGICLLKSKIPSPFVLLDNGELEQLQMLVGEHPDLLAQKSSRGDTLLSHAIANDDAAAIEYLLGAGVNPETKNRSGQTPLVQAVGRPQLLSLLLEKGARVNTLDKKGWSALHYAVERRCVESVELLLFFGVHINVRSDDARTPLMMSVESGFDVVDLLLCNGADPNQLGLFGESALHVAARENNAAVARSLLRAGAGKEALNDQGWTPLHVAALNGAVEVAEALLGAGVDVDGCNDKSVTPLRCAVRKSHAGFIEFCLEYGADVDGRDRRGNTCLHDAVVFRRFDIAAVLIEAGANPDVSNDSGVTVRSLLREQGREQLLERAVADTGSL